MNTIQLECFVHVAEKLNFTKAAEDLYITTPAVTHHIKKLEEELETILFIRNSKIVKLTEAGNLFYGEAKSILEKMDIAEKKVKNLTSTKLTSLKIGCTSEIELKQFENALERLHQEFPLVYPEIVIDNYSQLKSLFNNKQLDLMIATKEMIKDVHDCHFKTIKNIKAYAIVSSDSDFADKKELDFRDLEGRDNFFLITLHPRLVPFQYGNKLQELIALHSQDHFHILCENTYSAVLLAKCGYGISILPEIYLPKNLTNCTIIPFTNEQSDISYGIAYQKNLEEKHIQKFVNYLFE